jgi:CheY-like chemotaxis protein/nitrogen-specific signal transduction histidine kinase
LKITEILLVSLDPRTIMMMNVIGTLLMGLSLFVVSRGYLGQIKGVNEWAVATLIQSLGWLIAGALRGSIPDIISIVLGNGLILLCLGLYFNIIGKFNKWNFNNLWVYILIGLSVLALVYFTAIGPNVAKRIAIMSLSSAILMLATSYILFSQKNRPVSNTLTGSMFALCAFILIMRGIYCFTIDTDPNQLPFGPHPMQNISYLTFFITSVMLTFCFVLMCNDNYMNQRKLAEEELIKAKKLAEQLAGAKDRFLSNMSHEIRTPLNGIIGFTKILLQEELPPKQKQKIELIKTSSDILLVLINDILDLAKINEGKMTLEELEFNLPSLINDIVATFQLQMDEKQLIVTTNYDKNIPNLLGDSVRVSQILINLINNSRKFTENGGKVNIDVQLLDQNHEKATVQFIISDTGIGITEEKQKTIFEPFVQDDTIQKYEGTGLGLSIVKRLVNVMHGSVSLESKRNSGTAVTVTIPFKKTVSAVGKLKIESTVSISEDINKLGNLNILVADDNTINQLLAQTILHQFGFNVDLVDNGKKAIELLTKNQYDIVLMDLKMPEMGGYEATRYIRTQLPASKSQVPIIAITADVTKMDIDTYKATGMNDYVLKPFNQTELLNKITYLVKGNKSSSEFVNNLQL